MTLDMRGREIKVGSTVAYPDRRGANLWQNIAKVTKITTRTEFMYVSRTVGYHVEKPVLKVSTGGTVQRLDRVVVLDS